MGEEKKIRELTKSEKGRGGLKKRCRDFPERGEFRAREKEGGRSCANLITLFGIQEKNGLLRSTAKRGKNNI